MMLDVLITLLSMLAPWTGHALHEFDPVDLHSDTEAAQHVWSARVAAFETGMDASELLAVAWHESRFTSNIDAPDGGARGCGVMTPTPVPKCETRTLVGQYLDGAWHLRGWYDAVPGRWAVFAGLAGGYVLIDACVKGVGPARGCRYGETIASIAARLR